MSLSKAIRRKCLDCCCGSNRDVAACPVIDCPLWQHRFGCRPATVRRANPRLLDPVWVVLAGAVDTADADIWCAQVLADPRHFLPQLRRVSDERLAQIIADIRATPKAEHFRLGRHRRTVNTAAKPENTSVAAASLAQGDQDDAGLFFAVRDGKRIL